MNPRDWASEAAVVVDTLLTHRRATWPGIGRFWVKEKPARQGRNPQTGELITIPPRAIVEFRPHPDAIRTLGARSLHLEGFGTLEHRQYLPYEGRDPRTGERVLVAAKEALRFRASPQLTARIENIFPVAQDSNHEVGAAPPWTSLWPAEAGDDDAALTAAQQRLGVELPVLLRDLYRRSKLRAGPLLHLATLSELTILDGVLVFAHEQQRCWSWGIPLDRLGLTNPELVANPRGPWVEDQCSLDAFLRFFSLINRAYSPPCRIGVPVDPSSLRQPWRLVGVKWKTLQHSMWTDDSAVLDPAPGALGAIDAPSLERAERSLDPQA